MAPSEVAEVANSYTPNDLDAGKGGEQYGLSGNSGPHELAPIIPLTLQFVIAMIARFSTPRTKIMI